MQPLGRSIEYPMDSLRSILKAPPWDCLLANPLPHPRPDPRPGFWPWVLPRMRPRVCLQKTPRGAFNMLPRESIEYSFSTIPPRLFHSLSQTVTLLGGVLQTPRRTFSMKATKAGNFPASSQPVGGESISRSSVLGGSQLSQLLGHRLQQQTNKQTCEDVQDHGQGGGG